MEKLKGIFFLVVGFLLFGVVIFMMISIVCFVCDSVIVEGWVVWLNVGGSYLEIVFVIWNGMVISYL